MAILKRSTIFHTVEVNSFPPSLPTAEEALQGLVREEPQALHTCVQVFAPLLFALAERAQIADQEDAVEAILWDVTLHRLAWLRSGLAARVWVIGLAQRRLQLLRHTSAAA